VGEGREGGRKKGQLHFEAAKGAKNGNCIDVITCTANYFLKSINQNDRPTNWGGKATIW